MANLAAALVVVFSAWAHLAAGHTVITYPGWRGDNLITNATFPYGMQWMYPCGGLSVTKNRTYWPLNGGAIAFQPGWFQGHATALMYLNLGLGENPTNYSFPMMPPFEIVGPSNNPYPGTVCIPQVPLPAGVVPKNGDLASIQVVEAAKHGAGMFSCVDIIFTDDQSKLPPLSPDNCFNSTSIEVDTLKLVKAKDLGSCPAVATQYDAWGPSVAATGTSPTGTSSTGGTSAAPLATSKPNAAAPGRLVSRFTALMSFLLVL